RYGDFAMELLLNDMFHKGSKKENLRAKVFGRLEDFDDVQTVYTNMKPE
ncbi:MAG: YebC/PmpR family DNA-binding transcriptional regulator, partial [Prevotella sp.]|nr:YebC/PmpR family DNA-binding transcriptional regulator [Prevotella sp.]